MRFGTRDPAPELPAGERTELVDARVTVDGDSVTVAFGDCTLSATHLDGSPPNHYRITSGHCRADVPTRGVAEFDIADRRPDGARTEDGGEEAYVNVSDDDVFIMFEAPVPNGMVRYDCELHRATP